MAKNNNLTDFLTDVADAIREKKGTSALIDPQDFSDEIASISGETDLTETEQIVGQIEETVEEYSSTEEPLSATYFDIINGEISGFSQLGLDAYNNDEITDLVLPSSYSLDEWGHVIEGNDYSVVGINDYVFNELEKITSVNLPYGIISIGNGAFDDCSNLEYVYMSDTIEVLASSVFGGCTKLENIRFSNNLEVIASGTFYNCSSLTQVVLPSSLEEIGERAFYNCSALTSITIKAVTPPTLYERTEGDAFYNTNNCPIYVPTESVNAYKTAWSQYASRIQAEVV